MFYGCFKDVYCEFIRVTWGYLGTLKGCFKGALRQDNLNLGFPWMSEGCSACFKDS